MTWRKSSLRLSFYEAGWGLLPGLDTLLNHPVLCSECVWGGGGGGGGGIRRKGCRSRATNCPGHRSGEALHSGAGLVPELPGPKATSAALEVA